MNNCLTDKTAIHFPLHPLPCPVQRCKPKSKVGGKEFRPKCSCDRMSRLLLQLIVATSIEKAFLKKRTLLRVILLFTENCVNSIWYDSPAEFPFLPNANSCLYKAFALVRTEYSKFKATSGETARRKVRSGFGVSRLRRRNFASRTPRNYASYAGNLCLSTLQVF